MKAFAARLTLSAVLLSPVSAMAQSLDQPGDWSGGATFYGWLPVISGAQEGRDGDPALDLEMDDVLSRLKMAAMGTFELWNGRYGLLLDAVYVNLGNDAEWLQDRITVSTNTKVGMYTVAGAWRAYEDRGTAADLYAGIRFFDVNLDFGIATDARNRSNSASLSWNSAVLGLRGEQALNDDWTLRGLVDLGGFDGDSDLNWQVYLGTAYAFNDRWEASVGYRYLSILYEAGDRVKLDIDIQGPVFGVTYRF